MRNWRDILVTADTPILNTLKIIDDGARQIALVVDENGRLLGTVTDGDVRRGLLRGKQLTDPISSIMNTYPTVAHTYDSKDHILSLMKVKQLRQIPIIDEDGKVIYVETLNDLLSPQKKENQVILMAGGLGTRLSPLTYDCPKPLLKVGDKPILETILLNFIEQGFYRFTISVNYKAEMIENYFGDGSKWGVDITYLYEKKKLGTAGALGLLETKPDKPFIVMNGDLLTKVNFGNLLDFHTMHQSMATMCVRDYEYQVPYGVVKLEKQKLVAIEEKPTQSYFVSAGIYVFDPSVIDIIPFNQPLDMPVLFNELIRTNKNAIAFPVREYWLDIGRLADFERANMEFAEVFG